MTTTTITTVKNQHSTLNQFHLLQDAGIPMCSPGPLTPKFHSVYACVNSRTPKAPMYLTYPTTLVIRKPRRVCSFRIYIHVHIYRKKKRKRVGDTTHAQDMT